MEGGKRKTERWQEEIGWRIEEANDVFSELVSISCSQHLEEGGIVMAELRAASNMTKWHR